jgi:hypothetical protein
MKKGAKLQKLFEGSYYYGTSSEEIKFNMASGKYLKLQKLTFQCTGTL